VRRRVPQMTGKAFGDFAKSVWAAYPDASLEIINSGDAVGGLVATQPQAFVLPPATREYPASGL